MKPEYVLALAAVLLIGVGVILFFVQKGEAFTHCVNGMECSDSGRCRCAR